MVSVELDVLDQTGVGEELGVDLRNELDAEMDIRSGSPSTIGQIKSYISRKRKLLFLMLISILLVIIVAGIVISSITYFTTDTPTHYDIPQNFGVVIDLGSGGSRVTVFQWDEEHRIQNSPYQGPNFFFKEVERAISQFGNPSDAAKSLTPLLTFAERSILSQGGITNKSPLYIYGTGGMRILDPAASSAILVEIRKLVKSNYNFLFQDSWADILPIKLEATYDWISIQQLTLVAADYDLTTSIEYYSTEIDPYQLGILDMGGESIEISYLTTTSITSDTTSFFETIHSKEFNEDNLNLYVSGFEHMGHRDAIYAHYYGILNAPPASDSKYYDPCALSGSTTAASLSDGTSITIHGSSNTTTCIEQVNNLIPKSNCSFNSCSMNGAFYPPNEEQLFVAFSKYAETAAFFGLEGQFELQKLLSAANDLCSLAQADAKVLYPGVPSGSLSKFCFDGVYTYQILTQGYGFPSSSKQIIFSTTWGNNLDVSWCLGLMVDKIINVTNIVQ